MDKKIKCPLTFDEVEYLADLLRYEMADPESKSFDLEREQIEELQKKFRSLALEFDHWSAK